MRIQLMNANYGILALRLPRRMPLAIPKQTREIAFLFTISIQYRGIASWGIRRGGRHDSKIN